MVEVRVSRQSAEVVADAGAPCAVGKLDAEVAGKATETVTAVQVRVSRVSVEVVGKRPAEAAVGRLDAEVAGKATEAVTAVQVQVSRVSLEVVAGISPRAALTRLDAEAAGKATEVVTAVQVQVSRLTGEAVARRGSAGPIVPLALSEDHELFLHDWADELELHSAYSTDVVISHVTGAEARRGLVLKPSRTMDLTWRQSLLEFDAGNNARLDRLYVALRRMTDARFQVPLYCDQRDILAAYLSTDDTIFVDTTVGRWAVGARVAIVQLGLSGSYSSHTMHIIADMQDDRLAFTAALGVNVPAQSIVVPMLDCEILLETEASHATNCLAEVSLSVSEVEGASQLPPTKADTPTGGQTFEGVPILDVEPDWSGAVVHRRDRHGVEFSSGRGRSVSAYAARSRQGHDLEFTNERAEAWRLVELFDTRRGRLRSFWAVDHENIWVPAQLDPGFVSIVPLGPLDDVQEELENAQVGLVMEDGTIYVRNVTTVESVLTVYRFTVSPSLPGGLDVDDVFRVARARRVRFESDEMTEKWTTAGLCTVRFKIIEVLEEKDATLL